MDVYAVYSGEHNNVAGGTVSLYLVVDKKNEHPLRGYTVTIQTLIEQNIPIRREIKQ